MRAALYIRCSTEGQNSDLQRNELVDFVQARAWKIHATFEDRLSGTRDDRPMLRKMLADVRARRVDVVLCWRLDRLFRSVRHVIVTLQEFEDLGVKFVSLRDQLDLSTSTGRLLLHLIASFGEFEAALCRERVKAGLAAARRRGVKLGRKRTIDREAVQALHAEGCSYRKISTLLGGISHGAIRAALLELPSEPIARQTL